MQIIPIHINEFYIYDIFHNDNDNLVIICAPEMALRITYKDKIFTVYTCPHGNTKIYVLDVTVEYEKNIVLNINSKNIETEVNKYPEFKDELIASTMVKNEEKYIKQWIKYHRSIGIEKFIIYDNADLNSDKNELLYLLEPYKDFVLVVKWSYPLFLSNKRSGQTTQMNHSIWCFRNCKYIGLFDVDEYMNIQTKDPISSSNIKKLLNTIVVKNKINNDEYGSLRVLSKIFVNPNNRYRTDDFNFLKIYNCTEVIKGYLEKNFIIPKNVLVVSVHTITHGKKMFDVSEHDIFFNHYMFLNKADRAQDTLELIDTSIYRHSKQFLSDTGAQLHFVTYGDDKFIESRKRICNEAMNTGWFDTITFYTDMDISSSFRKCIQDMPILMKCFIWKFDIIVQAMNKAKTGDIIVYADCGCTINKTGQERFEQYIKSFEDNPDLGILIFNSGWKEKDYTNKKLFDYFKIGKNSFIGQSGQNIATSFIIKKNDHGMKILQECLKVLDDDIKLITDEYNIKGETHRHDQSILSLVTKIHGAIFIPDDTYNCYPICSKELSDSCPIIATRIRY